MVRAFGIKRTSHWHILWCLSYLLLWPRWIGWLSCAFHPEAQALWWDICLIPLLLDIWPLLWPFIHVVPLISISDIGILWFLVSWMILSLRSLIFISDIRGLINNWRNISRSHCGRSANRALSSVQCSLIPWILTLEHGYFQLLFIILSTFAIVHSVVSRLFKTIKSIPHIWWFRMRSLPRLWPIPWVISTKVRSLTKWLMHVDTLIYICPHLFGKRVHEFSNDLNLFNIIIFNVLIRICQAIFK